MTFLSDKPTEIDRNKMIRVIGVIFLIGDLFFLTYNILNRSTLGVEATSYWPYITGIPFWLYAIFFPDSKKKRKKRTST